jgi:hypothetical protein
MKSDLKETGWERTEWIHVAQDRRLVKFCG